MAAGAEISSRTKSFVRQTTPHFDGTSREVSYSVPPHHTLSQNKSKYFFTDFPIIFTNCTENTPNRLRYSWSFPERRR